ncbi:outer membrane protein assembly factor BamE domain-containing protein [Desulfobulbus elongatus]|uniref:outer membrane protein assembly factor BamE domain-containing protein n=1 Tax=Desulfobulbus elongatus TaxID=53332 RepID=UPI000488AA76|nr:outer membrane protein assembly factor BamE [Desulfobulbus elongatus]
MKIRPQLLRFLLPLCCCGLLLSGCASAGKDFDTGMVRRIQLHQTTRAQIEAMFGPPWRTGIEDGKQTWSYGYYKYGIGDTQSRDLTVRFDASGTVASYTFTSSYPEDQGL